MAKADLNKFGSDIIKAARRGLQVAAAHTEERLKENVSLTDHSLDALARLGHPYNPDHYTQIHDPAWLVHRQSSELYNSIKVVKENDDTYAIGADENIRDPKTGVKYVISVIEGTSKMVARNYPLETLNELIDSGSLYASIENELEKVV